MRYITNVSETVIDLSLYFCLFNVIFDIFFDYGKKNMIKKGLVISELKPEIGVLDQNFQAKNHFWKARKNESERKRKRKRKGKQY